MTSRERVLAALGHRPPDRTPIFEYVMHSTVAEAFLHRPYADDPEVFGRLAASGGYERAVRQRAADVLDLAERFGFDMLYVCPIALPSGPPPAPAGPADDPVQAIRRRIERSGGQPAGMSDFSRWQLQAVLEEMARRGLDLPILAPAYVHGVWTDVELMQTMVLAPQVAEELFCARTRSVLGLVDQYLAMGIRQIGVGGDFAGNRPIISAEAYRRFIMPQVCQVARRVHAGGGVAVNASDGDLWYVIEDFLIGCEVDGYIEIDGQAGMDLRRLKERFGGRITFYGNFDCMRVLSFADPAAVRAHALQTIQAGWGNGGHILCSNNAITASVPPANYLALQNAYREYFDLAELAF